MFFRVVKISLFIFFYFLRWLRPLIALLCHLGQREGWRPHTITWGQYVCRPATGLSSKVHLQWRPSYLCVTHPSLSYSSDGVPSQGVTFLVYHYSRCLPGVLTPTYQGVTFLVYGFSRCHFWRYYPGFHFPSPSNSMVSLSKGLLSKVPLSWYINFHEITFPRYHFPRCNFLSCHFPPVSLHLSSICNSQRMSYRVNLLNTMIRHLNTKMRPLGMTLEAFDLTLKW